MQSKKVIVRVGEPLSEDIYSSDGSVLVARKGMMVTREMLVRLANWIEEDEPRLPVDRTAKPQKTAMRESILKKMDFKPIISEQTRENIEQGVDDLFSQIADKGDSKLDMGRIDDSVAAMVEEIPDDPDVPLKLLELKRRSTHVYNHSIECGIIASFVGTALNYPECEVNAFAKAMMLHDIGVLSFPPDMLEMNKTLSDEEWALMRTHPRVGWDILRKVRDIEPLTLAVVIGHHVNAAGTGYPEDIDYNDLPPLVRLSVLINHFEALTANRPYRRAYSKHDAIKLLLSQRDMYDPGILKNFVKVVGVFPISTFVRLNTGEVGVVVRNNPENLFLPEIKLVMNPAGKPYSKDIIVNLLNEPVRKLVRVEDSI